MNKEKIRNILGQSFLSLIVIVALFVIIEPTIGESATSASSQFTIAQTVSAEVAFATAATNVTLAPSLGGLTGGDATGTTQVVVTTNDRLGYQMTIQATSSTGMIGAASSSNSIPKYVPSVAGIPDFNFTVPANKAYFGYTIEGSTTQDITAFFKNNGTVCNTGSSNALGHCWLDATTTAFTVVNRATETLGSGSTTTLKFHVKINANPVPVIPDDTYYATTTLTATNN